MTDEMEGPAGEGGAEEESNRGKCTPTNTTSPQFQDGKTNANSASTNVQSELGAILTDIANIVRRHLSLPPGAAEAIALWVISAHTLRNAEYSPRLAFQSPVPECGKSTALELLIELLPNPMPTSNVTPAAIYRSLAQSPSLIIDELDTFMVNASELTGILNSGHKRATAFVHRCGSHKQNYKPTAFPTFCPMVIARIGELPPALESRSIVIRMQRALPNEKILRLASAGRAELQTLKSRIETWCKTDEQNKLKDANPSRPVKNRLADNWRHLIAIAELAGGKWVDARSIIPKNEEVGPVLLLRIIKQTFDAAPQDKISSADLCNYLNNSPEKLQDWTQQHLASALRPFGIRPKMMRLGPNSFRGYDRTQFVEVWERYLEAS